MHRLVNLPLSAGNFAEEYKYILEEAFLNDFSKNFIVSLVRKHTRKMVQNNDATLYRQNNGILSEKRREMFCYVPRVMNSLKNRLKEFNVAPVYLNFHKIKYRFE